MIHEFEDLVPVDTPLGQGLALLIECDRHDNYWTVIMNNGAVVTFQQEKIRVHRSYTYGRNLTDKAMKEIIK